MGQAMSRAGVPTKVRFNAIGETGAQLVDFLRGEGLGSRIGGDAVLRVDNRQVSSVLFVFGLDSNGISVTRCILPC